MKFYRIRDWEKNFENNRTRTMDVMRWVPIPNKHDGDGYTEMVDGPDGAAIYGAWVAVIQVASKCHPRGTLLRDNKTPHTPDSIARVTRLPAKSIERAIAKASSASVGWLEVLDFNNDAQACQATVTSVSGGCGSVTIEGKGSEGSEGNRIEGKEGADEPPQQTDKDWVDTLLEDLAYRGIDVQREYLKMLQWCQVQKKQPTRRRFINWLNRVEKPMALFPLEPQQPQHRIDKAAREFPENIQAKQIPIIVAKA
jgi:hypothetical protein